MRRILQMETLEARLALAGIVNGAFDVADTQDVAFGWDVVGDVSVVAGQAVLREQAADLSELIQTFEIPPGSDTLTFTLVDRVLNTNTANPPDALEVALLDATTGSLLVGAAQGLAGSDALLNINATGQVYFGPDVTVPGAGASGQVATLTFPLTVAVDVSSVAAGMAATLYIDLLGFGSVDARLTVDDVRLAGSLAPSLTLAIDPATDSGAVGDEYTNFTQIGLVGTTEAAQTVLLDLDGGGFDDGQVNADAAGRFRFDNVSLTQGANTFRVQATNPHGTTELARAFKLDTEPVSGSLVFPAPGAIFLDDPGFVEIQWADTGIAGADTSTYDKSDVTVTGVSIDRIEDKGGGRVQYWYNDDGQKLPWGRIRITQVDGAVADRAGNGNASRVDEVSRLRTTCVWQNPDRREDTSNNGVITPLDALVDINRLNFVGSGPLPIPVDFPDVPPPFYDTNCDNFITPLDALIIINLLNGHTGGEGEAVASGRVAQSDPATAAADHLFATMPPDVFLGALLTDGMVTGVAMARTTVRAEESKTRPVRQPFEAEPEAAPRLPPRTRRADPAELPELGAGGAEGRAGKPDVLSALESLFQSESAD